MVAERRARLKELAALFLKLGVIGFGGPAAHIALMEEEVVRRRSWLSRQEFLDLLGATNLIPGPNSTELAIHIGHRRAGWPGLVVAGGCFILPAASIVAGAAWAYVHYGMLPEVGALLYGIKPVVIAIIVQALWLLTRTAIKTKGLALVTTGGLLLAFAGTNELAIIFGGGLAVWLMRRASGLKIAIPFFAGTPISIPAAGPALFGLWPLFLFFLKVGSVLFGSGYVLLAFLRADLVERWHWLTEQQLLDAIAAGQITPGPVFTTATFVGYLLGGGPGAVVATAGIFLPAFVFVALSGPLVPRIRKSESAGAVLDGINAASLSVMAMVTIRFGQAVLVDWITILLAASSLLLLIRFRINSTWLILGAALLALLKQ